jgi:hypothetical protein
MALVRAGFDVFSPEVDDKGIDFVLRIAGDPPRYHDVQVKTVRRTTYVFMRKDKFRPAPNLLLALVILGEGEEPRMFLIPSSAWQGAKPPFVDRDYDGKRSAPEYGSCFRPRPWSCSSRSASSARYPHTRDRSRPLSEGAENTPPLSAARPQWASAQTLRMVA